MHVLTKVFVVIAALLSVGLAALTMAYATSADRIVAAYRGEQAKRISAESNLKAAETQFLEEREIANAQLLDAQNTVTALKGRNSDLTTRVAVLSKEKREAEDKAVITETRIAALGEAVKTQATLIEAQRGEVTQLRDNELRWREQQLDYEDRINVLAADNEVLEQSLRALEEQVAEIRQAEGDIGVVPADDGRGRGQVRGAVQEVRRDVNGDTLIRVDLGTNDNITKNTRLSVARGDQFIGYANVIEVDRRWSLATLDTLGLPTQARTGDLVLTGLR